MGLSGLSQKVFQWVEGWATTGGLRWWFTVGHDLVAVGRQWVLGGWELVILGGK